jgi:SAM-dependent methyltransferase
MIENNLIKSCVCGNTDCFNKTLLNNLAVIECKSCGVLHQELVGWTKEKYYNFYKTDYHNTYQKTKGVMTYEDRYDHDCRVADLRLDSYRQYLLAGMTGLDIGSSNSAFVHRARSRSISCLGLEPGEHIGDNAVTIRGTLDTVHLNPDHFDFVTMHDSIEHMIDVAATLNRIHTIIKSGGYLILDLPDYFVPAGQHHWKKIEHLWFFNRQNMKEILASHGFEVLAVTEPIEGKLVFYTRKK